MSREKVGGNGKQERGGSGEDSETDPQLSAWSALTPVNELRIYLREPHENRWIKDERDSFSFFFLALISFE